MIKTILLFEHQFYRENFRLQLDSNSNRRSRRRACWPLDHHHHGPNKNGFTLHIFTVSCPLSSWMVKFSLAASESSSKHANLKWFAEHKNLSKQDNYHLWLKYFKHLALLHILMGKKTLSKQDNYYNVSNNPTLGTLIHAHLKTRVHLVKDVVYFLQKI